MREPLYRRLQKAMDIRGLRQVDLVEKTGISKSKLNMYVRGVHEPKHDNLYLLSKVLGVQEAWLMGYDVPMESDFVDDSELSEDELMMIGKYRELDYNGQGMVDLVLDLEWRKIHQLPLKDSVYYAGKIAAAGPGVYTDGEEGEVIKVKNKPYAKGVFAVGVNGDSMEPEYYDGDEVYVQPTAELLFGEIGYWRIGSECFIKEYAPDGLRSKNPKYPLMKATPDMVLIGKVIGRVKR